MFGLYMHIQRGWCYAFNAVTLDQETGAWTWNQDTEEWELTPGSDE